ncbi:MAG: hypothetical protein AB7U82_27770 [Blastocatellales bacterium]
MRQLLDGVEWPKAFGMGGRHGAEMRWDGSAKGIEYEAEAGRRLIKPVRILRRARQYQRQGAAKCS